MALTDLAGFVSIARQEDAANDRGDPASTAPRSLLLSVVLLLNVAMVLFGSSG